MEIRLANLDDRNKWDEYITLHPDASPYHLFAWKIAVEEAYKHRGYYLVAEEDSRLLGVLPLIFMKLPLRPGQLVSLPFCDLGGVLSSSEEASGMLIQETFFLARRLKAKRIELRSHKPTLFSKVIDMSSRTQTHKVSMLLELTSSSNQLMDNFKSKLRSQIRKSEKNGLKFVFGSLEDIDDFYLVFCHNMRELGSPVHSKEWFKCIIQHYGDSARLGLIYYKNKPIGGGIILSKHNKVCVSWASTLRSYNRFSPNMLLYWNFLKYSADNGYTWFDFGRSTLDEGTYKFKLQWGAKPEPLYWNQLSANGKEQRLDTKTYSKRETAEQIWQKLPLALTKCIGPSIRKYISL